MKKFIAILVLFSLALMSFAQSGTVKVMSPTATKASYVSPVAANTHTGYVSGGDTIGGTQVKYYDFAINKDNLYYYTFVVAIDTVRTHHRVLANTVSTQLQGSIDGTNFINVGSAVVFHGKADTTFTITDVSTGVLWPVLRVKCTGQTANKGAALKSVNLKIGIKHY